MSRFELRREVAETIETVKRQVLTKTELRKMVNYSVNLVNRMESLTACADGIAMLYTICKHYKEEVVHLASWAVYALKALARWFGGREPEADYFCLSASGLLDLIAAIWRSTVVDGDIITLQPITTFLDLLLTLPSSLELDEAIAGALLAVSKTRHRTSIWTHAGIVQWIHDKLRLTYKCTARLAQVIKNLPRGSEECTHRLFKAGLHLVLVRCLVNVGVGSCTEMVCRALTAMRPFRDPIHVHDLGIVKILQRRLRAGHPSENLPTFEAAMECLAEVCLVDKIFPCQKLLADFALYGYSEKTRWYACHALAFVLQDTPASDDLMKLAEEFIERFTHDEYVPYLGNVLFVLLAIHEEYQPTESNKTAIVERLLELHELGAVLPGAKFFLE